MDIFITKIIKYIKKNLFCIGYTFINKGKPFVINKQFREYIDTNSLTNAYYEKFQFSNKKGIDGKTALHLNLSNENGRINDFVWISNALIHRKYKFNNYQEVLINKGKGKLPRIVSKPTIRDKIVLYSIKEYFKKNIKESVTKQPNEVIDSICNQIKMIKDFNNIVLYKTDIKGFYDEISKDILLKQLDFYLYNEPDKYKIIELIKSIIYSNTIPFGTKKPLISQENISKGLPQGLSISNILANIYMLDLDNYFNELVIKNKIIGYHRYVDDILIIANKTIINKIISNLKSKITYLELRLHDKEKTENINLKEKDLIFLGYVFKYKDNYYSKHLKIENLIIIPKKESLEKFFKSILGMFSKFNRELKEINKLYKEDNKNKKLDLLNKNFIFRLNMKISGCISEDKRYGFFAYFSKTTSPYFAYNLKSIIKNELEKLKNKNILSIDKIDFIKSQLKDPISAYYSTQDKNYFSRNVIINFDNYMNYKEYVLEKDKEYNQKLSPESFLIEYDIEEYNHLTELYNGFELRKKIYTRFNQIKSKNLDLLNKDISSSSSLR